LGNENFLIDEYRLAHEELRSLWELYWRQASYFLTLNSSLIAFVSTIISFAKDFSLVFIVSAFGVVITILWLFHANRFYFYIEVEEEAMRKMEENPLFIAKLKRTQKTRYDTKAGLFFLKKLSGSKIRNILLPTIVLTIWAVILIYTIFIYLNI
jgi:hypothetical protein